MKDGSIWNWSSGAVPAGSLRNIASVKVQITGESATPDAKGKYAQTTHATTVNVSRISS